MSAAILDKVRKLRALAQSSNVHEAAAAARAANELLQKHRIDEAALEGDEPDGSHTVVPEEDADPYMVEGLKRTLWRTALGVFLAEHYGCKTFSRWVPNTQKGKYQLHYRIIGRRSDIETAKYMHAWLAFKIVDLCDQSEATGKAERTSFCVGAYSAIREKMKAGAEAVRINASSSALVKLDNRLTQSEMKHNTLYPDMKVGKAIGFSVSRGAAYRAGREAGASIDIGTEHKLGGNNAVRALKG